MSETIYGYEIHPACEMLPMMPEAALVEMAADIERHGQQQPVVLYDGKILDGRNRLRACELAGVTPEIREWEGDDPVRWVLSLNFHRRHLSDDQKAVVGARAERLIAERARRYAEAQAASEAARASDAERSEATTEGVAPDPGTEAAPELAEVSEHAIAREARKTAAALVNVSQARIARGRKLLERAVPELVAAVERGAVSMSQAARVAKLATHTQEELIAQGEEAVIDEARRIAQAKRDERPSQTRALAELDAQCGPWTLSRGADGRYRFEAACPEGPLSSNGATIRDALTEAWQALRDAEAANEAEQEGPRG